jgi:hypothetical protein
VARAQPLPEARCRVLAIAEDGVLVVHMPQREGGVVAVPFGQGGGDPAGGAAVGGRGQAVGVAAAVGEAGAVGGDRQCVGVGEGEPGRRGGGRGGEVDGHAVRVQAFDVGVEPGEVVAALLRFEQGPGENAHGDQVDPGLAHECVVLLPDGLAPLLGVVVPAEGEPAEAGAEGVHTTVHGYLSAPVVMPLRQYFCSVRKRTTRGMVPTMDPVMTIRTTSGSLIAFVCQE